MDAAPSGNPSAPIVQQELVAYINLVIAQTRILSSGIYCPVRNRVTVLLNSLSIQSCAGSTYGSGSPTFRRNIRKTPISDLPVKNSLHADEGAYLPSLIWKAKIGFLNVVFLLLRYYTFVVLGLLTWMTFWEGEDKQKCARMILMLPYLVSSTMSASLQSN